MGKNEKTRRKLRHWKMTTRKNSMSNSKTTETIDFRRRRLAAIFLVAFIIFAFSGIQLMKDYHRLGAFKQERADAIAESVAVDKKVKDLKKTLLC